MSREVIGSRAGDETPLLPLPRDGHATVTTLDEPPAAPPGPAAPAGAEPAPVGDPAGPESGAPSGPAGLLARLGRPWVAAGVVVAAFLTGALLGAGASERAATAERAETVRLLGGLTFPRSEPRPDGADGLRARVDVLVVNAGPEALRVTGARFEGEGAARLVLTEPFELAPGATGRGAADVLIDCDRPRVGEVSLRVQRADGVTREVPLTAPGMADTFLSTTHFGYLCEEGDHLPRVDVFSMTSRGDGSLSMQVRNPTEVPVELTFPGPVGVRIESDPPLPLAMAPQSSEFLILRVVVEQCTGAATRPDAGNDLRLLVDGERDRVFLDPVVTAGWLARQVALACPA